ncbi:MAG TPA: hypothetical protein VFR95_02295, partial [Gemmatimonadaceae bacterium]|nr:hypothetical protein [Gemmatimonadaceae bacterium]
MSYVRTTTAALILAAVAPTLARAQGTTAHAAESTPAGRVDSTAASTAARAADSTADSTADSSAKARSALPEKRGLDFSGWVFGDFQLTTDEASKAANGGKSPNRFDIGRAYLNFR